MADESTPQTVVVESDAQRSSRALAEAADKAAEVKADTMEIDPSLKVDGKPMTSGGRFVVDGQLVDSNGKAIDGPPGKVKKG